MATQHTIESERRTRPGDGAARTKGRGRGPEKLANALGWFSIGLGVTEIVAPRSLAKFIGISQRPRTTRLMGLREVAAGIGILVRPRPAPWLWARVGGDVLDLAALAKAGRAKRAKTARVSAAAAAVAGVTALDVICARQLSAASGEVSFTASVVVNRPPEECYRYWRNLEKLPNFFRHLKSVRVTGEGRSHWITRGLGGKDFSWDAEMIVDVPGQRIAWRSLEGADIPNAGEVEFDPVRRGQGTIARIRMQYGAAARFGASLMTKLLGRDPGMQVRKDLLRFKQLLETGEIATTEGQPAGRSSGATWLDRVARV